MSDEVKLPKVKLKKQKNRKFTIQTIEEYQVENRLPTPKPDISGFPDLFAPKLDKKKRDDIPTKVPVLKGTAGIQLYTSLLVARAEEEARKAKEEFLKHENEKENQES